MSFTYTVEGLRRGPSFFGPSWAVPAKGSFPMHASIPAAVSGSTTTPYYVLQYPFLTALLRDENAEEPTPISGPSTTAVGCRVLCAPSRRWAAVLPGTYTTAHSHWAAPATAPPATAPHLPLTQLAHLHNSTVSLARTCLGLPWPASPTAPPALGKSHRSDSGTGVRSSYSL